MIIDNQPVYCAHRIPMNEGCERCFYILNKPRCPKCHSSDAIEEFTGSGAGPSNEGWLCNSCLLTFGFTAFGRYHYVERLDPKPLVIWEWLTDVKELISDISYEILPSLPAIMLILIGFVLGVLWVSVR